jgi:hypothetical protein
MRSAIVSALATAVLSLMVFCVCALAAETPAAKPPDVAANLDLVIMSSQKVLEPGDALEVAYSLANMNSGAVVLIQKAASPVLALPLDWKITDDKGQMIAETTSGKPGGKVSIPGVTSNGPLCITQTDKLNIPGKLPLGTLVITASYTVSRGMYGSSEMLPSPESFVGTVTSKTTEAVVKPEGWREKAYRAYVSAIESGLREKLKPLNFEFREARNVTPAAIIADKNGASGVLQMNYEALDINDAAKTARLRTFPGSFTIFAGDPRSPHPSDPKVGSEVENGLIYVWFVADLQNKWFIEKLFPLAMETLKEVAAKSPLNEVAGVSVESTAAIQSTAAVESTAK